MPQIIKTIQVMTLFMFVLGCKIHITTAIVDASESELREIKICNHTLSKVKILDFDTNLSAECWYFPESAMHDIHIISKDDDNIPTILSTVSLKSGYCLLDTIMEVKECNNLSILTDKKGTLEINIAAK